MIRHNSHQRLNYWIFVFSRLKLSNWLTKHREMDTKSCWTIFVACNAIIISTVISRNVRDCQSVHHTLAWICFGNRIPVKWKVFFWFMSFQLKYSINIGYLDSKRKPITIYHLFLNERSPFYVLPSIFPHPSFINKLTPSMSYLLHLCSYYYILYILDISSNNITKQTFSSGELFKLFGERQ